MGYRTDSGAIFQVINTADTTGTCQTKPYTAGLYAKLTFSKADVESLTGSTIPSTNSRPSVLSLLAYRTDVRRDRRRRRGRGGARILRTSFAARKKTRAKNKDRRRTALRASPGGGFSFLMTFQGMTLHAAPCEKGGERAAPPRPPGDDLMSISCHAMQ